MNWYQISFLFCVAFTYGCGGPETPQPLAPSPGPPSQSAPASVSSAASAPAAATNAAPAKPPPPKKRFPGTAFPPPDFDPPFERSQKEGDGKWSRLGQAQSGDRIAADPPVMFHAVVHPHKISKYVKLTVVAIDLRHTFVRLVAGTDDPKIKELPATTPPGLVPSAHQDTLVAVMNGGFQPKHGRWGMMMGGVELVKPREKGCTIAMYRDDTIQIRTWPAVAGSLDRMVAYRQTPPCLLENGELHPDLVARQERAWAGRDPKRKTRRRSVLGIDASGRVLFYGIGEEAGPRELAEGMKAIGAVSVAQTDINWSWTRFLVFGKPSSDAALQVTSTLIPKMVHRRRGYVEKTSSRDFFFIARRPPTTP